MQPLLNGLHVLPLLLVVYAASTRCNTAQRRRLLQRERLRARHDGEERERRRWARELHDETLQELGAVQVVLSAAATDGRSEAMRSAIEQARGLVGNQITSLRHLIVDLRPAVLDELGLGPALQALCGGPRRPSASASTSRWPGRTGASATSCARRRRHTPTGSCRRR
ncbi:hypothetical protein E4K10_40375 [Streptomyces sp. T1317-0309]|nr:hypothetical protein E4K10_40375 [Streptomyces sp. T1317-0309]